MQKYSLILCTVGNFPATQNANYLLQIDAFDKIVQYFHVYLLKKTLSLLL